MPFESLCGRGTAALRESAPEYIAKPRSPAAQAEPKEQNAVGDPHPAQSTHKGSIPQLGDLAGQAGSVRHHCT